MKKNLNNKYKLNGGIFYNNDSLKILKSDKFIKKYSNKVDLVFTSPPFPLINQKKIWKQKR